MPRDIHLPQTLAILRWGEMRPASKVWEGDLSKTGIQSYLWCSLETLGKLLQLPVSQIFSSYIVVLSVAAQCSFEKALNKKIDREEQSEELPE